MQVAEMTLEPEFANLLSARYVQQEYKLCDS